MNFDIFAPDFGILPSAYWRKSAITNPIELFWSDDLLALLRLCGEKEEGIGERASDYDRFLALSRALPMLEGHPTRAWIVSVLQKYFDLQELPTEETAPQVWKTLSQALLEHPLAAKELVSGAWLCDALEVPDNLPEQVAPVLHADLLLHTNAKNAIAWSAEIASVVAHFAANRCKKIVLHIGKDFDFIFPSLYHVDRALSLAKKDREATNLLTAQLLRELCVAAQKEKLLLVLVCNGNLLATANLLQYAEESVGLPHLCWVANEAREASALLDFTAKPHKAEILAALSYDCIMTQAELSGVLEGWQMRYPVSRLCFVTARDLRQTPAAQAHISAMLKKSKTNI